MRHRHSLIRVSRRRLSRPCPRTLRLSIVRRWCLRWHRLLTAVLLFFHPNNHVLLQELLNLLQSGLKEECFRILQLVKENRELENVLFGVLLQDVRPLLPLGLPCQAYGRRVQAHDMGGGCGGWGGSRGETKRGAERKGDRAGAAVGAQWGGHRSLWE